MSIEIRVPRLGWSSEDGLFAGWLKQPGETVSSGEPLFALESDKVTMEVESLDSGVLHALPAGPEAGAIVVVGQLLGHLLAAGEKPPAGADAPALATPAGPAPAAAIVPVGEPRRGDRRAASPRARARARSLGIDIATVSSAAGAQRVVEADVLRQAAPRTLATPASRARKVIAARLEESFRTPHFYVHAEVDATRLAELRHELLPLLESRHGVRLTYNDLLVKAVALTLRAEPAVNCYWNQGEIVTLSSCHVGLAVQTDDTLVVPVIRDADRLPLAEIAAARQRLVDKCRRADVQPADLAGGSVTISNLGPYGVDRFQAILNPPQSAILAVGRMAKRPVVDGDAVVARLTVPITLSVDHRVVDGVAAAKFLQGLTSLLQSPQSLGSN